jgi:hypothetical protein
MVIIGALGFLPNTVPEDEVFFLSALVIPFIPEDTVVPIIRKRYYLQKGRARVY